MTVFLNGEFLPEHEARVSVFDRSFMYGDGVFETLRMVAHQPFRWGEHMARLEKGSRTLGINLPYSAGVLRQVARQLAEKNDMPDAILRIHVSRGPGRRGYSTVGADQPSMILSLHPAPAPDQAAAGWRLITARTRICSTDPLSQLKTANRLWSIMAKMEADRRDAHEALVLNETDHVAEASGANLFWLEDGAVFTPPLASGALPGVTRAAVIECCAARSSPVRQEEATVDRLHQAQAIFLTLSSFGIVAVRQLDDVEFPKTERISELQNAYQELVAWESAE